MTKTIISIVLAVLVLGGLIWFAQPGMQKNNTPPLIKTGGAFTAKETNYDFGNISMAAGKVKYTFGAKNTGSEAAVINKVYTSCMCTTATLMVGSKTFGPYGMPGHGFISSLNQVVGSGEEISVEVEFDPAAHGPAGVGKIQRSVIVENSAGDPLQFYFTANVTP